MLRKLVLWGKGKLYVTPTLYGLSFGVLSILLLIFDQLAYNHFSNSGYEFFFNIGSKSVSVFILVISCLVTMVTITFSIVMVVLTIYGSQLSSRSLQDFLSKKATLRISGYYIGALIFTLIQLALGGSLEEAMGFGSIVSILLLIIGIVVLVYFIHFISRSIQISLYIDDIVKETLQLLDQSKKHVYSSINIEGGDIKDYDKCLKGEHWDVANGKAGYIQYYDTKKLLEIATAFDIRILCDTLIGEYVLPNEVLASVYDFSIDLNQAEIQDKISEVIIIGDEPDLFRDISTGSKRLIDVALKALSPGINDPSTAISCIKNIGYLLNEIAKGLEVNVYLDDREEVRVVIRSISFHRLLFDHFYQIKHYGSKDMFVLEAILSALIKIATEASAEIKKQVWEFANYLIEDIHLKSYHIMEQRLLSERFYQLSQAAKATYEFDSWNKFLAEK